eukprot:2208249-Rhodomonas_salina.1
MTAILSGAANQLVVPKKLKLQGKEGSLGWMSTKNRVALLRLGPCRRLQTHSSWKQALTAPKR